LLPNPLRDRFGFTAHLEFYDESELEQVLARAATLLDFPIGKDAIAEIAGRCRGTPRIANRLLRRVRDYALVHPSTSSGTGPSTGSGTGPSTSSGTGPSTSSGTGTGSGTGGTLTGAADLASVHAALDLYDVDALGLDRLDRAVMDAIMIRFDGGPVGLSTLSVSVGEEAETIESVVEPFLVRIGLISRTPRGRVATAAAWRHFGIAPRPNGAAEPLGSQQALFTDNL
jgi:Holliday junction resolvasome, helicase subunit